LWKQLSKDLYVTASKEKEVKKIYVDGGGWKRRICLVDGDNIIVKTRKGVPTNNELEYLAVLYALEYIQDHYQDKKITIYSDSKLVVKQLDASWKIMNQNLWELAWKCGDLIDDNIKMKWTPRRYNLAGIHLEKLYDEDKYHVRHPELKRDAHLSHKM